MVCMNLFLLKCENICLFPDVCAHLCVPWKFLVYLFIYVYIMYLFSKVRKPVDSKFMYKKNVHSFDVRITPAAYFNHYEFFIFP